MTMAVASWKSLRQKGLVATAASLARWTAFEARSLSQRDLMLWPMMLALLSFGGDGWSWS
jgi:hypothetical protein